MSKQQPTILVVEDDNSFAYATSRYLQSLGYRTMTVSGSMAALARLDNTDVDLVITDIRLHEGEPHGLALGRMVATRRPKISVILVTAFPELLQGEGLPGPVLQKPVDLPMLAQAVTTSLTARDP